MTRPFPEQLTAEVLSAQAREYRVAAAHFPDEEVPVGTRQGKLRRSFSASTPNVPLRDMTNRQPVWRYAPEHRHTLSGHTH